MPESSNRTQSTYHSSQRSQIETKEILLDSSSREIEERTTKRESLSRIYNMILNSIRQIGKYSAISPNSNQQQLLIHQQNLPKYFLLNVGLKNYL